MLKPEAQGWGGPGTTAKYGEVGAGTVDNTHVYLIEPVADAHQLQKLRQVRPF